MPSFKFHNPALAIASDIARRGRVTMMARKLRGFVDKLEDVEDKYRDLYVEETVGDKTRFRLDADGVEDVTGLKNTVKTLRTENASMRERLEPIKDLGDDENLDDIISVGRATIEAKKTGKPIPEVEQERTRLTTQHKRELDKAKLENTGLMEALRESVVEGGAAAAITELKGNKTLLMPHIRGMIDIVRIEDGGKIRYEPRVFEGSGSERHERTGTDGKPLPIKAAVAELKANDDFSDAFEGSGASGSGAPPEGGSGMPTPRNRGTKAEPTPTAKDAKRQSMDYAL